MSKLENESLFSWTYWTPNTSFILCNVPWDMSYRDIVKFDTPEDRDDYFNNLQNYSKVEHIGSATMAKFGVPVRLRIPFNQAAQYNYIIAYNNYPDIEKPKKWFYFIQTVNYINAYTTEFTIMLDVWQSFCFSIDFGMSYVERGHVGVANENQNDNHGRKYLAIPEGLDTGGDMTVVKQEWQSIFHNNSDDYSENFGIVVVSNVDLEQDPGDIQNPHLNTAKGSNFENLPNGCQFIYFAKASDYVEFAQQATQYSWVTQGIVSIYVIPKLSKNDRGRKINILGGKLNNSPDAWDLSIVGNTWMHRVKSYLKISNFRNNFRIPERYKYLKKFSVYPYAAVELTCLNGQSVILKPELVQDDDLNIDEVHEFSQPGARIKFTPEHYNTNGANRIDNPALGGVVAGDGTSLGAPIDNGEYISVACGIDNFPTLTIVNNSATAIIAGQAHSLAWSYQNADWSQAKTMMGVNNAYAQSQIGTQYSSQGNRLAIGNRNAMNGITQSSLQTSNSIQAQQQQTDYNLQQFGTLVNGGLGVAQNALGGSVGGALGAAIGTGVSAATNAVANAQRTTTRESNLSNTLATNAATVAQANAYGTATTNMSNSQTMQFADMNRSLGTSVAQGDYANSVAGINAKVQDTALTQPSESGTMGGDTFNFSNGNWGLLVRFRQLPPAEMANIGEYWLRYGYYVQRFMIPPKNLKVMSKFSYWKMHELYIRSSTCPEEYRLTIKGIFEKGVTVWNKPEYIGTTDYADNEPMQGVRY